MCVAVSRAKLGLYVLGNFAMFARYSKTWAEIVKRMDGRIGRSLELTCKEHQQRAEIKEPSDFKKAVPEGRF